MVSVEEIVKAAEPLVGKLTKSMVEDFKLILEKVFKEEAAPALKKAFLRKYDELAAEEQRQAGPAVRGQDPAALENWRHLFEAQLDRELSSIKLVGDELVINVGNKNDFGFGDDSPRTGPPQTVDWLVYYIEGMIDQFAFITPEQYKARGRRSSKPLGRFGAGFLIPKNRYKSERWQEVTGLTFEDVRHPISGQRPFKGFEEVPKKFDFGKYIGIALEKASKAFTPQL